MHTKIFSATTIGVDAHLVDVEVDLAYGMINFFIVGLPDTAIKESRRRVESALTNCGVRLPNRKVTVNLAPADLKKEGTNFDLPIAIGILRALNLVTISQEFIDETLFIGELSLDGALQFVKGALAIACDAQRLGKKRLILPKANAAEAALITTVEVIGVSSLAELIAYLRQELLITPTISSCESFTQERPVVTIDFSQVKGQYQAKRALQIAAAGRHNILFIGPPGSGKTMLARRLATIMPCMTFNEVVQTSKVYSIAGKLGKQSLVVDRPFRGPHHTISQAGLVGGGSFPQPGEISLAHNGILFLDELTEFKRDTLEVLRQPLETKEVCIARAMQSVSFPAAFLMVAALNPCPCGFLGDKKRACSCSPQSISKYLGKLSGPLLDRIDLQISVQSLEYDTVKEQTDDPVSSAQMSIAVSQAVERQRARFGQEGTYNTTMTPDLIDKHCILTEQAEALVKKAFEKLHLSMRGYHKILKVARTIADLESSDIIEMAHVREAIMYRSLDQTLEKHRA